jgi:biotin carboxyl carrier protein
MSITSGLVGTFRAMSGAATLHVGDRVKAGQVLGQIEAIRLLNDCTAPAAGEIVGIAVQDGQPVEYGQLLFEIAPSVGEG